jgi:hypothetical protein
VDPVTLSILAGSLISGIGGAAYSTTSNNRLQRNNNEELDRLKKLKEGGGFGLTPVQQRQMTNDMLAPMQQAAAQGRSRNEQLATAMQQGGASGAALSRLREEEGRAVGQAANQVAGQVRSADQAAEAQQRAEFEGRLQSQAQMKNNDIETMNRAISSIMSGAGMGAGAPVGTFSAAGAGGAAMPMMGGGAPGASAMAAMPPETLSSLRSAGYSDPEIQAFAEYLRKNPQALGQMASARQMQTASPSIGSGGGAQAFQLSLSPEQLAAARPFGSVAPYGLSPYVAPPMPYVY